MQENKLVFNERGTQAWIVFSNEKDSLPWSNKKEALEAIVDCFKKGKITPEEAGEFLKKIDLSNLEDETEKRLLDSIARSFALVLTVQLWKKSETSKVLRNPTFEMCDCGHGPKHGYIKDDDDTIPLSIQSKSYGYAVVEWMTKAGIIPEKEASGIKVLIQLSDLPEAPFNPEMN